MNDDDIDPTDDPAYKAGLVVGRHRAITDMMSCLRAQDDGRPEQQRLALIQWCTTALEACREDLALVAAEIRDEAA